jgi:hypothetical protein
MDLLVLKAPLNRRIMGWGMGIAIGVWTSYCVLDVGNMVLSKLDEFLMSL